MARTPWTALCLASLALSLGCGDKDGETNETGASDGTSDGGSDGSADGTDGADGADGADGTDSAAPGDCPAWCADMIDVCPEEAIQPLDACEAYCAHPTVEAHPAGTLADTAVDSIGCRQSWLEVARDADDPADKADACANAAASGGDTCGSWCEVYCEQQAGVCPDNYSDAASCEAACASMPAEEAVLDGISQPTQQFGYGDTVLCRLHHTQVAIWQDMADMHCPHASERSTDDTCDDDAPPNLANYCAFATEFCGDVLAGMDDMPTCQATVEPVVERAYRDAGFASFTDTDVNSVGCLNHWIVLAPLDPATYCAMADWDPDHWDIRGGAGVCSAPTR